MVVETVEGLYNPRGYVLIITAFSEYSNTTGRWVEYPHSSVIPKIKCDSLPKETRLWVRYES